MLDQFVGKIFPLGREQPLWLIPIIKSPIFLTLALESLPQKVTLGYSSKWVNPLVAIVILLKVLG